MGTLSNDLRERIVSAYDRGDATRHQIAQRYNVSLGMVKKLLQQRRLTGQRPGDCRAHEVRDRDLLAGDLDRDDADRVAVRRSLRRRSGRMRAPCARIQPMPRRSCGGTYVLAWQRPGRISADRFRLDRTLSTSSAII